MKFNTTRDPVVYSSVLHRRKSKSNLEPQVNNNRTFFFKELSFRGENFSTACYALEPTLDKRIKAALTVGVPNDKS